MSNQGVSERWKRVVDFYSRVLMLMKYLTITVAQQSISEKISTHKGDVHKMS